MYRSPVDRVRRTAVNGGVRCIERGHARLVTICAPAPSTRSEAPRPARPAGRRIRNGASAGDVLEVMGGAAIVVGAVVATAAILRRRPDMDRYRSYRQALGRAILLGLEFLVAADVVRTVSRVPSLLRVTVLGFIVVIRTFLSFTLEVELEGRWPWQRRRLTGAARSRREGHEPVTTAHRLLEAAPAGVACIDPG